MRSLPELVEFIRVSCKNKKQLHYKNGEGFEFC